MGFNDENLNFNLGRLENIIRSNIDDPYADGTCTLQQRDNTEAPVVELRYEYGYGRYSVCLKSADDQKANSSSVLTFTEEFSVLNAVIIRDGFAQSVGSTALVSFVESLSNQIEQEIISIGQKTNDPSK